MNCLWNAFVNHPTCQIFHDRNSGDFIENIIKDEEFLMPKNRSVPTDIQSELNCNKN